MFGHTPSRSHSKHSRRSEDRQAGRRRRNGRSGRDERNVSLEQLEGRTLFTALVVNGTAGNDYISLAGSGGSLLQVDVNGTITHYNPFDYTGVQINGVGGNDIINILSTELPTTVVGAGQDTVTVGDTNGVQDITSPVTITNPPAYTDLTVDDSADAVGRNATISASSITNLAPAAINYSPGDLRRLTVNGGVGGNTFTVTSTPVGEGPTTPTNLNSGTGVDQVNVQGTAAATVLNLQGQNGGDSVNVGNAGSVQGINGTVNIENNSNYDTLTIDDSADATSRTATLSSFTPAGDGAWESVSGLAPAAINYEVGDVNSTTVNGGTGGNTFNVNSLADGSGPVNLNTGTGADQTNIRTTDAGSMLNVQGQNGYDAVNVTNAGSVQGILGTVNVQNTLLLDALTIDDSADATPHTATLSTFTPAGDTPWESVTGLAPGTINYKLNDIGTATIDAGSGGNTFNVSLGFGVAGGVTNLNSGTGADHVNVLATGLDSTLNLQGQNGLDTVQVGNAGSVQGIQGAVNIENTTQADVLTIDDSTDTTARTVTLSTFTPAGDSTWESVTGLAPAAINYEVGDVISATINGGSGGNTFNVNGLAAGVGSTFLNTGAGNDAVDIRSTDAGTTLSVDGVNGNDSVYVTSASSVQGVQGTVNIENAGSFDTLTIDDSADPTARTATLNSFTPAGDSAWESLTGLAPGTINFELADIWSATIDGGAGGNTFNVSNIGAGGVVNLNSGTGADHVNVLATAGGTTLSVQGQSNADIVSITNAGSVQGILGTVNIENTLSLDTLTIDDSADLTSRTATLSTFTPAPDSAWESLTGLAPGTINYELADMNTTSIDGGTAGNAFNVNSLGSGGGPMDLNTGIGADHVNVLATAAGSTLNLQGENGSDTVSVTNAGNVQGILGTVNIENDGSFDALTIDDSNDPTGRTATLSTFMPAGDTIWGRVSGLAPGTINFEGEDVSSPITIDGGSGGNTFNVTGIVNTTDLFSGNGSDHVNILATPAGTTLNLDGQLGNDTVNVGNAGSVQGIFGTVNIENTGAFDTLTIDDSADATPRVGSLGTFTPGIDSPWESVTGLAPGTINFEMADMTSTTINLGSGGNTFNVNSTAAGGGNALTINGGIGNDVFNVHATAPQTILSINYGGGQDTINLDFTSGNPLPSQVNLSGAFTMNGFSAGENLNGTTLNIGASTIYVNYVNPVSDPVALIRSYLKTGYNNGTWNGAATGLTGAINSSVAAANSGYMIGYADWADGVVAGQPANTVELKYTLGGDLNLSGTVNFADFAKVVADYGKPASWDGGAITYGATVSFADFALTVANYGKKTVTPLAEAMYAAASVGSAAAAMDDSDPSKRR